MGRVFRRGVGWRIAYCHHGKEDRESGQSKKEGDAKRLLQERLGEIGGGWLVDGPLTFGDLVPDYFQDHAFLGKRSLEWPEDWVANLRRFCTGINAVEINSSSIARINGWETGVRRGIERCKRWVALASCSMTYSAR